jgi:hypothetical protein
MVALLTWPAALACRGTAEATSSHAELDAPQTSVLQAPALAIPTHWQSMPQVSSLMAGGLVSSGISDAKASAWGDPSHGCYAISLVASVVGARAAQVEAGLRKGFASSSSPLVAAQSASRPPPGRVEVSFALPSASSRDARDQISAPQGRVRALLREDGKVTKLTAAACFFLARYPEQCERSCEPILASLGAP